MRQLLPSPLTRGGARVAYVRRPPYARQCVVIYVAFVVFFLAWTVFAHRYNVGAGCLAAAFLWIAVAAGREGVRVEAAGVRLIQSWRIVGRLVKWSDIERFEARFGQFQGPVVLIRNGNQPELVVPTYPPSKRAGGYTNHGQRAVIERQVQELNRLTEAHRPALDGLQTR